MNTLPQIRLRALEPEDLDVLYAIENDTTIWNVGNTNVPYSRYTLHDYIAHSKDDIYTDRQVRLMVENMNGEIVGIADVVNFDPQHRRAELGIVIMSTYRHQGYATAVMEEMLNYSLHILHLHQVYVIVDCGNEIALKLFNSLDFRESARLEHWLFDGRDYHDALLMQRIL